MLDFLDEHTALLVWLASGSVVMFFGSLVLVPVLVVRIPERYFAHERRPRSRFADQHPAERVLLRGLKNLLGVVFMGAGVAMLFLPGQGLLTIFIGFVLIEFPGKYRFERWLVATRLIGGPINWLRRRGGRPPLAVSGPASPSG